MASSVNQAAALAQAGTTLAPVESAAATVLVQLERQDGHPRSGQDGVSCPALLATILEAKFGQHLPLNRQGETYAREGIRLDVSTMADWVGARRATSAPLVALIRAHVLAAGRLRGDDTTVPMLAKNKTNAGRL